MTPPRRPGHVCARLTASSPGAGDRIVDELKFDEVAVNPPLTKADFSR
jgi:hypothetical protein